MQRKLTTRTRNCVHCGAILRPWHLRYCSEACYQAAFDADFWRRLWSRVDKSGECWVWQGQCTNGGYGQVSRMFRMQYVHRLVYEWTYGPIPDGLVVRHLTCDNPPCCRPDHLAVGTQLANVQDSIRKGRHRPPTNKRQPTYTERARGARVANARFTDDVIREIRRLYATGTVSQKALAQQFGTRQGHISNIVLRKVWQHVA